jgi:hypothetical protein
MTNPWYDWPLSNIDLQKYVTKKYNNVYDVNHWEDSDGYEVDETASGATPVTHYLYEEKLNDAKRPINIIKPEFVDQIIKEFKQLVD